VFSPLKLAVLVLGNQVTAPRYMKSSSSRDTTFGLHQSCILCVLNVNQFRFRVLEREPTVSIELEWGRPTQTYGDLLGYRLRYGVKDQVLIEQMFKGTMVHSYKINDLGKMNWYSSKV
jgi:hypothetical protein